MIINMKKILHIIIGIVALIGLVSCGGDTKPSFQYMPNMYEPVGYKTYGEYEVFPNQQAAMLPVLGTVPRGYAPYEYPDTTKGSDAAKKELKNPLEVTQKNLDAGKELYLSLIHI